MKKTLLITLDFWPNMGGVSNYYYNLAKLFPKDKIVILSNVKPDRDPGFRVVYKKLLYELIWPKWIKSCIELFRLVKKEKIEIVWIGNILPLGICGLLAKIFCGVPYFVSLHGLDIKLASKSKRKKIFTKFILKNAKFVTVNSETTLGLVSELIHSPKWIKKVLLLYPGIDKSFVDIDNNYKQGIINKYNLANKKIILSVGRVVVRKNHELIIDAIDLIKKNQDIENLRYLIIGFGDNLEHLKQKVKDLNLETCVLFLENVSDYDLPYFYDISNMFAMVSKTTKYDIEGFGIVYLEAGIFKKPVLASKKGGGAEAVQDGKTGILVDENNVIETKEAILYLLNDQILSCEFGENAHKRIINNFLWEDNYQKLENRL